MADGRQQEVAEPRIPPGFQFLPTDEELVVYYLRRYVSKQPLPVGLIVPFDIYATDPRNLLRDGQKEAFFFARRSRISANSKKPSRTAGNGSEELQWHSFKKKEAVMSAVDGRGRGPVGVKHSLTFTFQGRRHAGLIMYEFILKSQEFQEVALCHVKVSDRVWFSASNKETIGGVYDRKTQKKRTAADALDEQPATAPTSPLPPHGTSGQLRNPGRGPLHLGPETARTFDFVPLWLWSCVCELLFVDDGDGDGDGGRRRRRRIDAVSRWLVMGDQTTSRPSESHGSCGLVRLVVELLLHLLTTIQEITRTRGDMSNKQSAQKR